MVDLHTPTLSAISQQRTPMFKPMLAATVDDASQVQYPVYASPKFDGVRMLATENQLLSRSLKPIPSYYFRDTEIWLNLTNINTDQYIFIESVWHQKQAIEGWAWLIISRLFLRNSLLWPTNAAAVLDPNLIGDDFGEMTGELLVLMWLVRTTLSVFLGDLVIFFD